LAAADVTSALGAGADHNAWLGPGLISPLANGPLTAQAIGVAANQQPANVSRATAGAPPLIGSVLPNVQASVNGTQQAQQTSILANPRHPSLLISDAQDYNCSTFQGIYFSTNGGASWGGSCLPAAPGSSGGAGEAIVGWGPQTSLPIAYGGGLDSYSNGNYEVVVARSTDDGGTWSTPVVAAGAAPNSFMDRPWLEVDHNPTSPFKGALYVSATKFNTSVTASQISVSHSNDGGQTWKQIEVDAVQNLAADVDGFSKIAIAPNGTVYVSWMRCVTTTGNCAGAVGTMYISRSKDGGNTWSLPHRIHKVRLAPASCGSYYGCLPNTSIQVGDMPVIAVDTSGTSTRGRLYVVDYTWSNNHMRVRVSPSADGGKTWGTPVGIARTTHDQFYPWINVSDAGVVGATWLDRREDPSNRNYDAFAATSVDGGATFGGNVRLSSASSNPGTATRMGDYTGNAWTNGVTQKLLAAWTDTRTGTQQDEVGGLKP
jgi:hypothetical protein